MAGELVGKIGPGLVVLVGVSGGDTLEDASYLAQKVINLRVFADEEGKFNLSASVKLAETTIFLAAVYSINFT